MNLNFESVSSAWCINTAIYLCQDRCVCGEWGFHWQPVWMRVSNMTVGQHRTRLELNMARVQGHFLTHGDMRSPDTLIQTYTSTGQWTWLMTWSCKPAGCLCERLQPRHYTLISSAWPLAQQSYHPESFRSQHNQHSALSGTQNL